MRYPFIVSGALLAVTVLTPAAAFASVQLPTTLDFTNATIAQMVNAKAHVNVNAANPGTVQTTAEGKIVARRAEAPEITITGTVTALSASALTLKVGESSFSVQVTGATKLMRRFGGDLLFSDIQVNDQLTVQGKVSADKQLTATQLRDLSLQTHNGTFTGTITTLNADQKTFVLKSVSRGLQTITLTSDTKITKNGETVAFSDLAVDRQVTVSGVWDRTNSQVTAKKIAFRVPLVRVHVEGKITAKNGNTLTVLTADQKTYTVHIDQSSLVFSTYARMKKAALTVGDSVDVWARGESGSLTVKAYFLRDLSQMSAVTRVLRLNDNGSTLALETGDRVVLKLGSTATWGTPTVSNTAVLAAVTGQAFTFKAVGAGQTQISVTGTPVCSSGACPMIAQTFTVTVNVANAS